MKPEDQLIDDLAQAILDGDTVDWNAATPSDGNSKNLIRHLKVVATLAELHRGVSIPQSPTESKSIDPPLETWGHLRVGERIGRGAFGVVHRAWDTRLDREVALKLIPAQTDTAAAAASTIIREGRLLARVRHPNVATIYGADRIDGYVGLWMEFVRGRTLEELLREGARFEPAEVARIGVELGRALAAVHAAGLLHRDIKAQNVMRADDGRIVLMDFGTGREVADEESDLTGTPLYLAPELFEGQPATVRSDIYSLGVLLYYLLSKSYPVAGKTIREVRAAHAGGTRVPLDRVRSDVPQHLTRVIERAVDPRPAQRYAAAEALCAGLEAVVKSPLLRTCWRAAAAIALTALLSSTVGDPAPRADIPPAGTTIRGRIVSADSARPLRHVLVRASTQTSLYWKTAMSDDEGRYEIRNLAAGQYTLTAAMGGYVRARYGQKRLGSAGTPIDLSHAKTLTGIDFALARGGVIAGRIVDETGDPVSGASIRIYRPQYVDWERTLTEERSEHPYHTDDLGQFRVFGLAPGDYYVGASHGDAGRANDVRVGFSPTFFPGTAIASDAQAIAVDAGTETDQVVFALVPARTATISGVVRGSNGRPLVKPFVQLSGVSSGSPVSYAEQGSTFSFKGLPPGEYHLLAQGTQIDGARVLAQERVTVNGTDIAGIVLTPAKGVIARGRIVFDGAPAPAVVKGVSLSVHSADTSFSTSSAPRVADDGSFELPGIRGSRVMFRAELPEWSLRSVHLNGVDITDTPIDITAKDIEQLEIAFSQRLTGLSGIVVNSRRTPVPYATIVVFADDREHWRRGTRYVKTIRAAFDGTFSLRTLPPARYVVVAPEVVEPEEHTNPDALEAWRSAGSIVTLSEDVTVTVNLVSAPMRRAPIRASGVVVPVARDPHATVRAADDSSDFSKGQLVRTGSTVLRGRVTRAETGQPLGRAYVEVATPAGPSGTWRYTAVTNDAGRYELRNLPPGTYSLQASRTGFLKLGPGQRRPFEPGRTTVLVSGATVDDIDFALPTAGAISGRVLDEMGEPITGAEVHLLRYRTTDGVKMLTLVARAANPTDDLGQFRIGGVPQGEYYLCAEPFGFGPLMPSEFARLARTYYPGTPAIDSAQKISIGIGEEMSGLVLPVVRVRPATLSGVVIDSDGTPTRDVTVSFQQASFGNQFGTSSKARDGRFELNGEPPGDYFLQASVDSSSGRQQASAEVTLAGIDTSVTLRLGTAVRIGGRITLESGPRDESLRTSRLWAVGAGSPDGVKSPMAPYLPVRDDWTFDGWAVPGWRSLLRFTAPEGWTTSRITGGGRDLTDEPVEFVEDLIDLEVVLTNRVTTVSGFVRDARGNLLRDAAVIVFADDPRKWRPFTRYVRAGVLDQTGRFTIRGLPAGRYLAVALDHLEEGAEGDPELLARLRGRGTPITLGDAEARTMELRVVDPIR